MQRFGKLFNDTTITNTEMVKQYLELSFKKRRPKKDFKFYINICIIYDTYPETINEILDNIPTLGYYKDYFYILSFSKNDKLTNHIYDIIVEQIRADMHIINNPGSGKITTMGKYLPREKSKINTKCNFINEFNKRYMPNVKNRITAKKIYRQIKTTINKHLGTIESKICTGQLETIDFDLVAPYALKKATSKLMKNEICWNNFVDHETNIFRQTDLTTFVKEIILNDHSADKMDKYWTEFNYCKSFIDNLMLNMGTSPNFNLALLTNSICVADLSNETYMANADFFVISMLLVVDKFSVAKNKTIINDMAIDLTGNIVEKINQIIKQAGPCPLPVVENYIGDHNCIIFATTKDVYCEAETMGNLGTHIVHFVPRSNKCNVNIYANNVSASIEWTHTKHMYPDKLPLFGSNGIVQTEPVDNTVWMGRVCGSVCMLYLIFIVLVGWYGQ